ncbi:hypothetical protein MLD38_028533 [Melastoma candidum]|uniref:Uncharacterized protein n=1 Tax=Melastoma candidum TaxID=119954 RepID=A0ACB9N1D8_9MYRT|nr:hypothetical protein MLD38_028533 [Melastoma candidum]
MDGGSWTLGLDLGFVNRRRRRWILVALGIAVSGYGAYRVYNLPSVARRRRRLVKIVGGLISLAEALSESANTALTVSRDLREFIEGDSDRIPNSCRQILKIGNSPEVSKSVVGVTRALTVGVLEGYFSGVESVGGVDGLGSRFVDKLFTPAGSGFMSVVVGSFARNLVSAFLAEVSNLDSVFKDSSFPDCLNALYRDEVRDMVGDLIQRFVGTAVAVYLDKTMHINLSDALFAGLTNPKHERKVQDILATICNGAVETLVRTSHQVISSPNMSDDDLSFGSSHLATGGAKGMKFNAFDRKGGLYGKPRNTYNYSKKGNGWVNKVSSTLAVPSNRRLVVDLTGRVTYETVRSMLEFMMEKSYEGMRQKVDAVQDAVIDKGIDVVRYVTAKSSVVTTICLSLCLHVLDGAAVILPV